jgi:serine/threonine protein kinase
MLEAVLGVGGMAQIYRAWDLTLGREAAVKVLPAALASDPGYLARFRAEARRVSALQHPHIVPVYYWVSCDGGCHKRSGQRTLRASPDPRRS